MFRSKCLQCHEISRPSLSIFLTGSFFFFSCLERHTNDPPLALQSQRHGQSYFPNKPSITASQLYCLSSSPLEKLSPYGREIVNCRFDCAGTELIVSQSRCVTGTLHAVKGLCKATERQDPSSSRHWIQADKFFLEEGLKNSFFSDNVSAKIRRPRSGGAL